MALSLHLKKLWYLPLEPIDKRYTIDWYSQFPEIFGERYDVVKIVGNCLKSNLQGKFFLDPVNTNLWKMTQMKSLLTMIGDVEDGDIIFVPDGWYPGLECLAYIRDMAKKKIKIYSYWHAGSYDPWDLITQAGMRKYAKGLEEAWFEICDMNFVATEFHKNLILKVTDVKPDKIAVVGFPLDISGIREKYKKGTSGEGIFFAGRKSIEKGYDVVQRLKKHNLPNYITVALDKNYTREKYYEAMNKHSCIFAPSLQETFGIGVIEGMALGLRPVVPKGLSFTELVPKEYSYASDLGRDYLLKSFSKRSIKVHFDCVNRFQYQDVIRKIMEYF